MKPSVREKQLTASNDKCVSMKIDESAASNAPVNKPIEDMSTRTLYMLHRDGKIDEMMEELIREDEKKA